MLANREGGATREKKTGGPLVPRGEKRLEREKLIWIKRCSNFEGEEFEGIKQI